MPCKQGESADVKGSECLGKRIRAAARINVGGRAYYCGREAELLRPPARNRVLYLAFLSDCIYKLRIISEIQCEKVKKVVLILYFLQKGCQGNSSQNSIMEFGYGRTLIWLQPHINLPRGAH